MMAADPLLRFFGLCGLDVMAVRAELGSRSRVIYKPDAEDPQLGHAHVVLTNLDDPDLQAVLLRHARVIIEPQSLRSPPVGPAADALFGTAMALRVHGASADAV